MDYQLYHGDRLDFLRGFSHKAQLILTSPPYNNGKAYEAARTVQEYVEEQRQTIQACVAVLSDTGSLCWQVGHMILGTGKNKQVYPLDLLLYPLFIECGLKLRNRIIWHFGHGLHDKVRFSGRHETILWFTKTDDYVFNLDPVRVPQKYPGKKHFKGPNKGKLSGNPLGKNPGDVWDMPNVKNNHVEKVDHPCQFPVGLAERLVLSLTDPGDWVVDPYVGVGSSLVAAALHGRHGAGADIEQKYLWTAQQRIGLAQVGLLVFAAFLLRGIYTSNSQKYYERSFLKIWTWMNDDGIDNDWSLVTFMSLVLGVLWLPLFAAWFVCFVTYWSGRLVYLWGEHTVKLIEEVQTQEKGRETKQESLNLEDQ